VSFAAQLTGAAATPARDSLILHSAKGNFAIRRGLWKYIEGKPHPQVAPAQLKALAEEYQPQLYDLRTDPGETNNLFAARPAIARELQALLDRQREATGSRDLATRRSP
jgi:arylsulfatase A-like enzyme